MLHEAFVRAISSVYQPHGFDPPSPAPEVFAAAQRHIIESQGASHVVIRDRLEALADPGAASALQARTLLAIAGYMLF